MVSIHMHGFLRLRTLAEWISQAKMPGHSGKMTHPCTTRSQEHIIWIVNDWQACQWEQVMEWPQAATAAAIPATDGQGRVGRASTTGSDFRRMERVGQDNVRDGSLSSAIGACGKATKFLAGILGLISDLALCRGGGRGGVMPTSPSLWTIVLLE
jgi:hypothetical protein